ncbi:hypothetical protein PIB30_075548 [Stylosanthes scabra]|uniref:Uncharacterized protein n=1 Tax=Stylosanthes scabra TaxID=79078 RepID=A0ABU6SR03_9FABA|nr:hypothetical protein [Stylosanthes scabra]
MSLSSINHQGFSKQVMEEAYSYDQGYTPWNPPPYQHHTPRDDAYQSNGYGDAYYGYEDPPPPYLPSQIGIEEAIPLLCLERKDLLGNQRQINAQVTTLQLSVIRLMIEFVNGKFNNSSITSQPLHSGDLPSQSLSNKWRSIPTLSLCKERALLNEKDVESLDHKEVHECVEEVEEENEDQEAEDINQEVKDKDKEPKGMEIVHSASSEATPPKFITCGKSYFKAYSGHLHKLHNNRAKVRALSMRKHLGPYQFQEKLVNSQNNWWANRVWDPEKAS